MKAAESASAPRCSQAIAEREVLFWRRGCRGGFTGEKNSFWGLQRDFPLGARLRRPGGFPLAPWTPSGPCCCGMYPPKQIPRGKQRTTIFSLCIRSCENHLINKPAPPLSNGGATDCQKTFRRCRRGRSPSDFYSCKPALPASRVVDFACKINSLQIRATSG